MLHLRDSIVRPSLVRSPHIHYLLIQRNHNPQAREACVILIGRLRLPFLVDLTLTRVLPPWALLWKLVVPPTPIQDVLFHPERVSPVCLLVRHADYSWRPKLVIHPSIRLSRGIRHYKRDPCHHLTAPTAVLMTGLPTHPKPSLSYVIYSTEGMRCLQGKSTIYLKLLWR